MKMTTLDASRPSRSRDTRGVAPRVFGALVSWYKSWKNRREIYELGLMSESELADIGLRRADLSVAWRTPLGEDPTARLGAIAEARAAADLAQARRSY
jgi:uncharacterized protein YjiS (DUF1127 family)